MSFNIKQRLSEYAEKTEFALEKYLSERSANVDEKLLEAMRYSALGGGKRIRAFLVFSFAKMFGANEEAAAPFACAVEMIHAYSLIHDDLPCMDDSDMRRGKPACHKKFGEAIALLAGDALLTHAFEVAASNKNVSDKSACLAVQELSKLASHKGMCSGQAFDLEGTVDSYENLCRLYSLKTGDLIEAACKLGYYAACDNPDSKIMNDISSYAQSIGLAFQIHDDILDVVGDAETVGKPVGNDAKNDKKTVLAFKSLNEAYEIENDLTIKAVNSISEYADSDDPCQLAVYLMTRKK